MEKNYINWRGNTQFYVDLVNKEYGVLVSIEDTPKANEIIKNALNRYKNTINAWKQEWKEGVA